MSCPCWGVNYCSVSVKRQWEHLMSVFVGLHHPLYDSLDIFIGCFYGSIHLGLIWWWIVVFNLVVATQSIYCLIVQVAGIISSNLIGDLITTNYLFLIELNNNLSNDIGIWSCFNPFGEVIYGHKNETMSVGSFRLNPSDHIYAPHGERLWRCQNIQMSRRDMYLVCINLTFVILFDMV